MTHIERSALIARPASKLFELVDDIAAYPDFVPWCVAAEEHERNGDKVVASLSIARGGVKQSFTTENTLFAPNRIDMRLVDGPFTSLSGAWRFDALGDLGCKVTLQLDFELSGGLVAASFAPLFNEVANTLVDAFCQRAQI